MILFLKILYYYKLKIELGIPKIYKKSRFLFSILNWYAYQSQALPIYWLEKIPSI